MNASGKPCRHVVSMKMSRKGEIVTRGGSKRWGEEPSDTEAIQVRVREGTKTQMRDSAFCPRTPFPKKIGVNKAASNTPEEHSREPGQVAVGGAEVTAPVTIGLRVTVD